ncbi:chitosanase [Lactiplantibacillus mudanjiangensis]|uniref:Chitosanase [Lactobacillus koreensis] n=1 Tax=Lactiplantibacillus mudanjiangensis TaxID=1296538 RepID=A0A660E9Q9_9LACO|nr:chitosanase [Lactiplantibacillus mudanjiangensis]VDG21128.1 chitosanase [Lactobacillus koreensis] [Lactiplantibacillus mudanjiangensis]VDG22936.1 chitosanase [Lactobacillus koreensis] [Lactiplantibacillus mudanjiangensis]VDG29205.1 chitosanase [Lactobacillus koreensis] [Lactiplantibacillus mudanjiangensis]VDG31728.1 chitosanase [Lactobacillus koreensis] [Lactiplantibacillus mudanjiangensis]
MKKWGWGLCGLLVLLGLIYGGYWWYQRQQTIATGNLRATTFALVSSAENSSLNYHQQYRYIEDIGDGRGYTAGIIGFTSGTGDLLQVVRKYQKLRPHNRLVRYLPALKRVNGTASHQGLGPKFVRAWRQAARDQRLIQAQDAIVDRLYLRPAIRAAQQDGLTPLGQYIYYDAMVVHGPGASADSFGGIRRVAKQRAKTPRQGGQATTYLRTFLTVRAKIMRQEKAHHDLSRLKAQWQFVQEHKDRLQLPLTWTMYQQKFRLTATKLKQLSADTQSNR